MPIIKEDKTLVKICSQ